MFAYFEDQGRLYAGWSMIVLTLFNILVNIGVMFGQSVKDIVIKCRKYLRERKVAEKRKTVAIKAMEKRVEENKVENEECDFI
jgi:hypothetical protein